MYILLAIAGPGADKSKFTIPVLRVYIMRSNDYSYVKSMVTRPPCEDKPATGTNACACVRGKNTRLKHGKSIQLLDSV